MNILVINYEYPPLGGGGGVAAKKLCEGLVKQGHKIDYLTTLYNDLPTKEIINGVNIFREKIIGKRHLKNASMLSLLSFPICAYKKACVLCEETKYDFIHTHFAVPSGPLGMRIANKFKLPNILFVYGGDIYDPTKKFSPHRWRILRALISKILNNANAIIAESSDIKDKIYTFYQTKKNVNILPLIYNEIPYESIGREGLHMKEQSTYLISVGRLVKRKGFSFLLDMANELNDNIKILIIGEGPERVVLEKKINELDLKNKVFLLGNLPDKEKFQYLSNSDLYILSSVHEGFGIVLQEAMQVGLPIVATNDGGQKDIIIDGINGYLITYGNTEEGISSIRYILNNESVKNQISKNNLNKIKEFSEDAIVDKCVNIMRNCNV